MIAVIYFTNIKSKYALTNFIVSIPNSDILLGGLLKFEIYQFLN